MDLRKEYLVCYDISQSKNRNKLHDELLDLGLKAVQKSVFWGFLSRSEYKAALGYMKRRVQAKDGDRGFLLRCDAKKCTKGSLIGHTEDEFLDWPHNGTV